MTLVLAGLNTFFVLYAYYPTQSEFHQDRERAAGLRSELPKPSTQHPSKSYSEGEDSMCIHLINYESGFSTELLL